ncbi:MAG TPA: histidine phosphatase family protein [Opitutaceae bacterium]|jgi:phosphohistidine phosphatase|nr:histidine phosphatase family protein [Opitutaceae bacterium]
MTTLYLIRHAHAADAANDFTRSLSAKGRKQVEKLARFLERCEAPAPAEIWHSPLVRARETANLLADGLKWGGPRIVFPGLEPEADPGAVALRIEATPAPVAIVGHEPHLSALGSLLVAGKSWPPLFLMQKCSVLALERSGEEPEGRWCVHWHICPLLTGAPLD